MLLSWLMETYCSRTKSQHKHAGPKFHGGLLAPSKNEPFHLNNQGEDKEQERRGPSESFEQLHVRNRYYQQPECGGSNTLQTSY